VSTGQRAYFWSRIGGIAFLHKNKIVLFPVVVKKLNENFQEQLFYLKKNNTGSKFNREK
jgi:hypothetical protein